LVTPSIRPDPDVVNVDWHQYDDGVEQGGWLTAAEATRRLGVKPQTLYAYVSRGLIRRERVPGTRTSRYAGVDVDRLAAGARPRPRNPSPEIVVDQAVTRLDPAGHLSYRGWDVARAAVDARYEEVAAWLWGTPIGPHDHWSADPAGLALAIAVQDAMAPDTPLPDRLRVVVAALRSGDPLRDDRRVASIGARAGTLLATLVEALPPVDHRDPPSATGSLARRLWIRVSPLDPSTRRVRALDQALSLLADHELATSTLAVRVAASTWADPYLLVLTGLATAGGPLHGGASEFVRRLLRDAVATSAEHALGQVLRDGDHVPGFGHTVYEGPDPRAPVLLRAIEHCQPPRDVWRAATDILHLMDRPDGPYPNMDFALGVLGESMRMVEGAGEAVFAIARTAGWIAHGMEEYQHRLRYRIRATYTGPRSR
jgi:citrate synthase